LTNEPLKEKNMADDTSGTSSVPDDSSADDGSGTLTVPDITIVGEPMSKDRAAFLDRLAWNPAEAMRNWGRLTQDEQAYVEGQMGLHYGTDFVRMFDNRVSTDPRPDATILITNDPTITPQWLQSAGYSYKGDTGGASVWVHPTGKEVWVMSPPNAAPAPSADAPEIIPQAQPPTHPDVEDAQNWANNLESRLAAAQIQYDQLQQLKDPDTGRYPQGPTMDYLRTWNALDQDVKSVLNQEAPLWDGDALTDDERAAVQAAEQRIKNVKDGVSQIEP
jgi:hypothetical protein